MTAFQPNAITLPGNLEPDNPLWRYALACWQTPGLPDLCLSLQVNGWNVTRILCAGWLGQQGCRFTGQEAATVTEWRSRVTGQIRSARQALSRNPGPAQALRKCLAEAELQAEQTELALAWYTLKALAPEASPMEKRHTTILDNLMAAAPDDNSALIAGDSLASLAKLLARSPAGGLATC
ncbi:MAG TPA: TIGR02444 family protein [Marinobacter sp.]|jgi:uncharacterized protein (TIGR02444 family)|nr:TIGR02444 family protein [Marinobacter sp.]